MATTVQSGSNVSRPSGAVSSRTLLASLGLHGLVLALLALLPAVDRAPRPEIDVVFRPQPGITVPEPVVLPPSQKGFTAARPRPGPLAPPSERLRG